ncbi:MAG: transposase [Candidatus Cloacimonetes bacterium]|jgi:putative transposase|nr:transposase [Candidatus Cloacimonadota bacterium]
MSEDLPIVWKGNSQHSEDSTKSKHSEVDIKGIKLIYEEGCYYHLYNRGCNRELIFQEEQDYQKLLQIITESKIDEYLELCAFSLMPNHYHFMVKQISSKSISGWIQFIFNRYVRQYNFKYNRKGTLFESKVKVKLISKLEYLENITHYIHNNPNSDLLKKYSSLNFFEKDTIVNLNFYFEFFNGLTQYFEQFEDYKNSKNNELIEDYLFND